MSEIAEPVAYQHAAYEELREAAADFFDPSWHKLPLKVRIAPLLCGGTGTGKTFLARRLAAELNLPLFIESTGDWMLLGSHHRGAPPTLPRLYAFVDQHEKGVIVIDELEKLGTPSGATDWRIYQQLEIFNVIDRIVIPGVIEHEDAPRFVHTLEELATRFQHDFLIVGCGAWQDLWAAHTTSIGFGESRSEVSLPTHEEMAATLRIEVLNRFTATLVSTASYSRGLPTRIRRDSNSRPSEPARSPRAR